MIDNPDGTRRVPTKEEVLEYVRQQRLRKDAERTAITSKHDSGSSESVNGGSGELDKQRLSEASADVGRTSTIEGSNGSYARTSDTPGFTDRIVTGSDSGANQHSIRNDDYSSNTTAIPTRSFVQPVKSKSKFAPYREAIKEAFTKKKPEEKKSTSGAKSKPLTDQEARQHREGLIEVILWQSEHIDNFITATTKGHKQVIIWSDIDREDATVIADFLLSEGKKSVRTANLVRNMVELKNKIQVGLITIPRAYRTLQMYLERGIGIR